MDFFTGLKNALLITAASIIAGLIVWEYHFTGLFLVILAACLLVPCFRWKYGGLPELDDVNPHKGDSA